MSFVVRFSPDLTSWIVERLGAGNAPRAIVATMIEQRMDATVAHAIVDAVVVARLANRPVPVDSITIEEDRTAYVYEPPVFTPSRLAGLDVAPRIVARCDKPLVVLLDGLLRPDECDDLVERARPRLATSTVVDTRTGADVVASYRDSQGMFFRLEEDPFIARLDRRISAVMNLPVENGEGLQVLHYTAGARNDPHFDFLQPTNDASRASIARSGQRVSTLIVYLNDGEAGGGGETVFPAIGWSVAPRKGCALYFEYANALGQVDPATLHAGARVERGEKWIVTKWMRQRRFVSAGAPSDGMVRG